MVPVALVARSREDLVQRGPQPERAVADADQRGFGEAAVAQAAQDVRPRGPEGGLIR